MFKKLKFIHILHEGCLRGSNVHAQHRFFNLKLFGFVFVLFTCFLSSFFDLTFDI